MSELCVECICNRILYYIIFQVLSDSSAEGKHQKAAVGQYNLLCIKNFGFNIFHLLNDFMK